MRATDYVGVSAGEDDEVGAATGLAADALIGDDERSAGRQQLAYSLHCLGRQLDAVERFGGRGGSPAFDNHRLRRFAFPALTITIKDFNRSMRSITDGSTPIVALLQSLFGSPQSPRQ